MGAVRTAIIVRMARFASPGVLCVAANEDATTEAANDAIAGVFSVIEGGKMIVPFAERAVMAAVNGRNMRVLQRIDAQAGNSMRDDLGGWIKRKLVGRPIFLGHPYHADPVEAAKWPDKRSRGTIKDIIVANDRIELEPGYNGLGRGEVDDGQFLYHSPQWRMEAVMGANGRQEIKEGMPVFRPTSLHSAGLTNNPNLDVPSLVAANEDTPASDLASLIKGALLKEGLIKEGDSDDVILAFIGSLINSLASERAAKQREADQCAAMAAAMPDAGNEGTHEVLLNNLLSRLQAQAANEAAQATAANEASASLASANARFEAARAARVNDGLTLLIKGGHLPNAQRETVRAELVEAANEEVITTRLQELAQRKTKLGTGGGVTDAARGGRKLVMAANESAERSRRRHDARTECLKEITSGGPARPGDDVLAWNLASSRNPELFKQ
jgi:hypothetical protein